MALPLLALLMGGLGVGKTGVDMARRNREKKVLAAQTRLSPFTGRAPTQQVSSVDPFGNILQGVSAGAALGQAAQAAKGAEALQQAQTRYFDAAAAGANPYSMAGAMPSAGGGTGGMYAFNPYQQSSIPAWSLLK